MFATTRSYLDHNATTPVRPAVAEAMLSALQMPGNPSSVHSEGRAARGAIEQAREQVAALVGAKASNVVFTSGGTKPMRRSCRPASAIAAAGASACGRR